MNAQSGDDQPPGTPRVPPPPQAPPHLSAYPPPGPHQPQPPPGPHQPYPPAFGPAQPAPWQPAPPVPAHPGAPPKRSPLPWIVGGGLGALLVLVLCCAVGAAALLPALGGDSGRKRKDPATERAAAATSALVEAAERLAFSPGVRYRGQLTSGGDLVSVDARVTNAGSTLATLTVEGKRIELLATSDQTYVKAGQDYWQGRATAGSVAEFARQWVKVRPDTFGVDLSAVLAPGLLADELAPFLAEPGDQTTALPQITPGPMIRINEVDAQAIAVDDLTVYVTRAEPRRILRVSSVDAIQDPSFTPSAYGTLPARAPLPSGQLDLVDLAEREVDDFYRTFEQRLRQLRNSVDSEVRFSLSGAITLAPCHTSGCQANISLTNRVNSGSKYLAVNRPVHASITVDVTLDGRLVKRCTAVKTMKPNGRTSMTCRASYYIAPSRNPRQHQVYASFQAVARALVDAEIKTLLDDVRRERERACALPKTKVTTPSATPPAPDAGGRRSPPPCDDPPARSKGNGPGAWRSVNRGDYDALWKRYQEQISGVKRGKEYSYNNVDYDGYRNVDGKHVFMEAKSRGYSKHLTGAAVDKTGRVTITSARARDKLTALMTQLNRQLQELRTVPGARLRYVMAEKDALDKIKAFAKQQLRAEDFERIDWEHVDNDFDFKGC